MTDSNKKNIPRLLPRLALAIACLCLATTALAYLAHAPPPTVKRNTRYVDYHLYYTYRDIAPQWRIKPFGMWVGGPWASATYIHNEEPGLSLPVLAWSLTRIKTSGWEIGSLENDPDQGGFIDAVNGARDTELPPLGAEDRTTTVHPHWPGILHTLALAAFITAASIGLVSAFSARRLHHRRTHHLCERCGYPLDAAPRCPECGTDSP